MPTEIPRIYTALAEILSCLIMATSVKYRVSKRRLAEITAFFAVFQSVFMIVTDGLTSVRWILCMLCAFFLMGIYLKWTVQDNWETTVFLTCCAFIIAEFAAAFGWQLALFFVYERSGAGIHFFFMMAVYAVVFSAIRYMTHRTINAKRRLQIVRTDMITMCMTAAFVFLMSNLGYVDVPTPFTTTETRGIMIIRTLVDFCGTMLIFIYLQQKKILLAQMETQQMENLLQRQYQQYEQSKESIDLINMKYHDLKHQLQVLRQEADQERQIAYIDQMTQELHNYEAQNKTGNKVADIILTGKSMLCEKERIELNSVVDGKELEFLEPMDLCSLLGNALDNAIECEKQIESTEKRLIYVAISRQKNFLLLRFENYMEQAPNMKDGWPVTQKKDKTLHGYGLKSVRYIVKKYQGSAVVDLREHWFELKILIPIPEE